MAITKDALFDVETPAPLSKFNRSYRDEDNLTLLKDSEDARLMPKGMVKKYERRLSELNKEIEQSNYHELKKQLEDLKRDWSALQLELYPLRKEHQQLKSQLDQITDDEQRHKIQMQMAAVNRRAKKIIGEQRDVETKAAAVKKELEPIRPVIRKRQTCENRLKEHYAAEAAKRLDDKLTKQMATEAQWFSKIIIEKLSQLGFRHQVTVNRGGQLKTITHKVKIERIVVTPDSIQYKFKVASVGFWGQTIVHLPYGVVAQDLVSEKTLNELTIACERSVTSPHLNGVNFVNGVWIELSRNDFVDGLPKLVHYRSVMTRYPSGIREKFPLPVGVMSGRKVNIIKLTDHPHLLISGQSGAGKSNTLHVLLCTLIQKHPPEELRLALIDLKAGVEFVSYDGIPHLIGGKPISTVEGAAAVLYQLQMLINVRLEEIKKIGLMARDIDTYNKYCPPHLRMPRIVIVIEEIQLIDNDKDLAKQIRRSCDVIASTGRAAGIQLIICTQAPFSDVIPKITQAQISCKIAGSQESLGAALATTGSTKTQKLKQHPGRMWVKRGPDYIEVQMPLIGDEDIRNALEIANQWDTPAPLDLPALPGVVMDGDEVDTVISFQQPELDDDAIIEFAMTQLNGELNAQKMIQAGLHTRYGIGINKLKGMVAEIKKSESITYDGETYEIVIQSKNIAKLVSCTDAQRTSMPA